MSSAEDTPGPGRNVAVLRKERDMSQAKLARAAGVSVSLLSKIEVGDRTLSQGVAAALARAMGITLDELYGKAEIPVTDEAHLKQLRDTIRRFDLPGEPPEDPGAVQQALVELVRRRNNADLRGVLEQLPPLLADATNLAHRSGAPGEWTIVADIYSSVYWLAARHRWSDLAELAVLKQRLAADRATPLVSAVAARDEAGTFLNSGDFEGGLAVVDRAIVTGEAQLSATDRAPGLGLLHLRGLTLAGRLGDRVEADRHIRAAWRLAENLPRDIEVHGIHFGPENTATHVVATSVDLERHREAIDLTERLHRDGISLPATRLGPLHMNTARAKLALRDRDGAVAELTAAWDAAPQMARVHPMSLELLRVLVSLHRRSNPTLTRLARKAGLVA